MNRWKTALVLVVIGAVSGALIFFTNAWTEDGIAAIRAEREEAYYRDIFDLDSDVTLSLTKEDLNGVLVERILIEQDGQEVGIIYKGSDTNSYGEITVLVGILPDGTIAQVVISASTNTPIFVNIIETDHLDPFAGMDVSDVSFDARTGATYTYGSVADIVRAASDLYVMERGDSE